MSKSWFIMDTTEVSNVLTLALQLYLLFNISNPIFSFTLSMEQ